MNVDVAVPGGNVIGLRCVLRDDQGCPVAIVARKFIANWDAHYAEFAAARLGVLIARRMGY